MKLITAIIKPNKVESVKNELSKIDVSGITLTEVKGFGRQKGHKEVYRGTEIEVSFLPKSKLEIAVKDEDLEAVIAAIQTAAKTDQIGDGKIFVTDLSKVVRIRTGETGPTAI
jgi:nitrogen regulatory protein P-II 2|tara:strand:+ start:264 stop:602 length:339 start_codon:yes stop_codon:yes gene_type:complete